MSRHTIGTRELAVQVTAPELLADRLPSDFFDALAAISPTGSAAVETFTLLVDGPDADVLADGRRLPRAAHLPQGSVVRSSCSADGRRTYIDWDEAGVFTSDRRSGRMTLHADPDRSRHLGWAVGTVVGTVLARRGAIRVVHGSLLSFEGANILVAGRSGSGKTTVSLLLMAAGATLVTEDITYVGPDNVACAVPIRDYMTMRAGTWAAHREHLLPLMGGREPDALRGLRESIPESTDSAELFERGRSGQVQLLFADLFHGGRGRPGPRPGPALTATVDHVVIPELGPQHQGVQLHRSSWDDAQQTMHDSLPLAMITFVDEFLALAPPPPASMPFGLFAPVPAWTLQMGIGAGQEPADLTRALSALAG